MAETRKTRPISWLKTVCLTALTIAAEGGKADIAKPLHGIGSGVLEIALPYRGGAFRVVYATAIGPGYLGDSRVSEEIDPG